MIDRVPGVVSALDNDGVLIECRVPDAYVEINVSSARVPAELRRFGCPVWVSADTDGIVVEQRHDVEALTPPEDMAEIEAWISGK